MLVVEVVLILIGVVFLLGSFMVKDKLSSKDIDQISKLSDEEIKRILQKKLQQAENSIDDAIDEKIDDGINHAEVSMDKLTNEKIMGISEYSDTVLDSMNKTHNEIMFLYSMLNDKHQELTELAGQLSNFSDQVKAVENAAIQNVTNVVEMNNEMKSKTTSRELLKEAVESQIKTEEDINHNEDILFLHAAGKSDVEIAKQLGLGLGEVKLVIGLFNEEQSS